VCAGDTGLYAERRIEKSRDPESSLVKENRRQAPKFCRLLLFPRHAQLDHHPLLPFFIDRVMAMEEQSAVFLKVCLRNGLAPRTIGIEGRRPQDDILAVERPAS